MGVPFGLTNINIGGVDFSAVDTSGVAWLVDDIDGWEGSPAPTLTVTQKPLANSGWAGKSFFGSRHISLSGHLVTDNPVMMLQAKDILNGAIGLDDTLAVFTELGVTRSAMVRRSDEVIVKRDSLFHATWSVQVIALDFRKFGTPVTGTTKLPSSSGGLSFGGSAGSGDTFTPDQVNASAQQQGLMITPNGDSGMYDVQNADGSPSSASSITMVSAPGTAVSFPLAFNSTVVSGQVPLNNPGNESGPVRIRIDGPCVGPQVAHVSTGNVLTFSSSLVLQAGEWIDIDMEAQTVLANGQSSRAKFITSRGWSGFDPGNNTWSFTATAYTSAAQMSVSATPAWK